MKSLYLICHIGTFSSKCFFKSHKYGGYQERLIEAFSKLLSTVTIFQTSIPIPKAYDKCYKLSFKSHIPSFLQNESIHTVDDLSSDLHWRPLLISLDKISLGLCLGYIFTGTFPIFLKLNFP